jgi:hypothetical protein
MGRRFNVQTRGQHNRGKSSRNPSCSTAKDIQEAIKVSRRLKVPYLGIDSLCILQDSPDDWEKESLQMQKVYSYSHLNISAAHAETADVGLFHDVEPDTQ